MSRKEYTTAEAAEYLDLTQDRVQQFCQQGRLGRKIGRNWSITGSQLKTFAALDRPAGRRWPARR